MSLVKKLWNVFTNRDPTQNDYKTIENGYRSVISSSKPDRTRRFISNERSIIMSIYNRIALDVSAIKMEHVRVDVNGNFVETMDSSLNDCLTLSPNKDQTSRSFVQDVVLSMFDEGCVAIVPYEIETKTSPELSDSYDIVGLRVGKIVTWASDYVMVDLYDERTCQHKQISVNKKYCAIVENPFYAVMNEPNSILKRLVRKLNLLDVIDEQSGSGKLDLIIQLPYTIKTEAQKQQADRRKQAIEEQLANSKFGIAYTDGTERIVQLNRSVENNLMSQIEYLTNMMFGQLGMDKTVFDGTANEQTMLNYYNRSIEPVLSAITLEMKRKWLTKTARTQGQSIEFFRDPFKLVPTTQLADLADRFTRNEILSSNEFRAIIGYKPDSNPRSDELVNKNIATNENSADIGLAGDSSQSDLVEQVLDQLQNDIDGILGDNEEGTADEE